MATEEQVMQLLSNKEIFFYGYLDEKDKAWWVASTTDGYGNLVVQGNKAPTIEQSLSALIRELTK